MEDFHPSLAAAVPAWPAAVQGIPTVARGIPAAAVLGMLVAEVVGKPLFSFIL